MFCISLEYYATLKELSYYIYPKVLQPAIRTPTHLSHTTTTTSPLPLSHSTDFVA